MAELVQVGQAWGDTQDFEHVLVVSAVDGDRIECVRYHGTYVGPYWLPRRSLRRFYQLIELA